MRKIFSLCLVLLLVSSAMIGCASEEEILKEGIIKLETKKSELNAEIDRLEEERDTLANVILDTRIETGTAKYIVTFNIKQSHFTLDLGQHFKDAMNDISIQIPVDKEYYDSVEVGDVIDDSFRMGSFIFKGSFGNWDITVEDKCIQ